MNKMNWKEIDLKTFINHIRTNQYKNVIITINTNIIESTIPIYKCKIINNKIKMIIVDNEELELSINIDPQPKVYTRNNKSIFKMEYEFDGEIKFDFFN